eukprot:294368-Prorocentrum_lima.AAC.1
MRHRRTSLPPTSLSVHRQVPEASSSTPWERLSLWIPSSPPGTNAHGRPARHQWDEWNKWNLNWH